MKLSLIDREKFLKSNGHTAEAECIYQGAFQVGMLAGSRHISILLPDGDDSIVYLEFADKELQMLINMIRTLKGLRGVPIDLKQVLGIVK